MALADFLTRFALQQDNNAPPADKSADSPLFESQFDWASISQQFKDSFDSVHQSLLSIGTLWQLLAILAAVVLAFVLSRFPAGRLRKTAEAREHKDIVHRLIYSVARIVWPAFTVIFLWIATAAFNAIDLPNDALRVAASLLNAWIVVRLVTSNMKPGFWQTFVAVLAWTIAALYILHLLAPVASALNSASFSVGGVKITALRVITSIFIAIVALWAGRLAGDAAQS